MRWVPHFLLALLVACGGRITEAAIGEPAGGAQPAGSGGTPASKATGGAGGAGGVAPEPQPRCGNGVVEQGEECDDGWNDGSYGGCNPDCTLAPRCGDGWVQGSEQCDDGNRVAGDGCSAGCMLEDIWCRPPSACIRVEICGDGLRGSGEECDDGNVTSRDGCSEACRVEPGWICPVPGTPCVPSAGPYCGDGSRQGSESCDDGINDGSYGGCNPDCTFAPHCGDGVVQLPYEQCDDGNHVVGDGCSAGCLMELLVPV